MVSPADYALTILIGATDVTNHCDFDTLSFEDELKSPSYFSFVLQNSAVTPAIGDIVEVIAKTYADTPTIFYGYIMELEGYKRDNAIVKEWKIEAADMKIRLQNAVLPYLDLSGADSDVIADLFANAYPDLSDVFDWTSGINGFVDSLNLTTNNDSLLDMLNKLADLTGANLDYDRAESTGQLITYGALDTIGYGIPSGPGEYPKHILTYTTAIAGYEIPTLSVESSGGNPGACGKATVAVTAPQTNTNLTFYLYAKSSGSIEITNVRFDYKIVTPSGSGTAYTGSGYANTTSLTADGSWHSIDWDVDVGGFTPFTGFTVGQVIRLIVTGVTSGDVVEIYIDNVEIITTTPFAPGVDKERVNWKDTPTPAPFNLDIANGDEFAFDINDFTGGVDNFNSVIVVGGKQNVVHDKIYAHDGENNELQLSAHIKSIAVYKNTGNDVSPSWTSQSLGVYGTDALVVDGGTKNVLYDAANHYLIFNTNPSNLVKSVRVTGTIEKPLRVKVENAASGQPVLAKPIYDDSITSEEDAIALGNSVLSKQNNLNRVTFKTYEPYLKPGQEISIVDSARGLAKLMKIQRVQTRWLGGGAFAEFTVDCGADDKTELSTLIADIDRKANKNAPQAALTTSSIDTLTDSNNSPLTDSNGALLYELA